MTEAFVQPLDNTNELDRVHIVNRCRSWVISHARRITGQRQHVAHPERGHAEKFALQPENIPIAAAEVE